MTIKALQALVGTLSGPSKMPCHSYSIPATLCKVGQRMRDVKNSICSICYALKGRYNFKNVQDAQHNRFDSLLDPEWSKNMSLLIDKKEKSGYFRWHDAGDLQGEWHLDKIARVAIKLPHIKFWLPTREYAVVACWLKTHSKPRNLIIRLSAMMLDGKPPETFARKLGLPMSGASDTDWNCPASLTDENSKVWSEEEKEKLSKEQINKLGFGKCGDCRMCWDENVELVNYKKH